MSQFDSKKAWLESLKAGDVVGCYGALSSIPMERAIDRVTATQIIVGHTRYAKKNGYAIGSYSRCSRPMIVMITDAIREQMERHDLILWAGNRNWNQSTTEQLRAMKKTHDELAAIPASNKEQA